MFPGIYSSKWSASRETSERRGNWQRRPLPVPVVGACRLIRAQPLGGQEGSKTGKKGSDKGIDGMITFIDDRTGKREARDRPGQERAT